jgi:hypothetical protein
MLPDPTPPLTTFAKAQQPFKNLKIKKSFPFVIRVLIYNFSEQLSILGSWVINILEGLPKK